LTTHPKEWFLGAGNSRSASPFSYSAGGRHSRRRVPLPTWPRPSSGRAELSVAARRWTERRASASQPGGGPRQTHRSIMDFGVTVRKDGAFLELRHCSPICGRAAPATWAPPSQIRPYFTTVDCPCCQLVSLQNVDDDASSCANRRAPIST